jgi:hypothetical protein
LNGPPGREGHPQLRDNLVRVDARDALGERPGVASELGGVLDGRQPPAAPSAREITSDDRPDPNSRTEPGRNVSTIPASRRARSGDIS